MSQKQVQQLSTNLVQTQKTKDVIEQVEKQEEVSKQNNDEIHEKDNQNDEFPSTTVKADQIKVDEDELSDNQLQSFQTDSPQKANQYKNNGNQLFKSGKCTEAIMEYQRGLKYTNDKTLRATLYSNMVISFIKLQDFAYAKNYCKKVLKEDQNHRKGRMNLARCYQEQKKIEEAYEQYKKLQQNLSGAPERDVKYIKDKISQLKPKIDELNETRKKQVVDGLKNIGNSILGYFGMSLDNFKLEQGAGGGYNISFKQ